MNSLSKVFISSVSSLYVHVPFCATKCEYCAFYSEASNGEQMSRYVDALILELELVSASLKPRTVFFGGGTPSLLSLDNWRRIMKPWSVSIYLGQKSGRLSVIRPRFLRRKQICLESLE